MLFCVHHTIGTFQCNNLVVSYIPVISKHFRLMVTIIKHINVFLNSYIHYLLIWTVHVDSEEMGVRRNGPKDQNGPKNDKTAPAKKKGRFGQEPENQNGPKNDKTAPAVSLG